MPEEIANKKVFISHASEDKDRFVLDFARRLREHGVDVWVDFWEMLPGDSLVDKIFEEGIKNAGAMLVILSRFSVVKPWIREEMNLGFIKRLSGHCKVIPVVIDDCEVPEALQSTIWQRIADLENYDAEFNPIVDAIYGRSHKPPLGAPLAIARRKDLLDDLSQNKMQLSSDSGRYTLEDLESFLSDKSEPSTLRLQALDVYLASPKISARLLESLLDDADAGIRRAVLRHLHLKPSAELLDIFDEAKIRQLLTDPELEAAASATRLACDLVQNGRVDKSVLTAINHHSYWLVRKIAIECITKLDRPDVLELLYEFRTTSYHVSQQLIREYIKAHYESFPDHYKQLAIDLLQELITAKHASELSRSKTRKLMDKLLGQ